MSTREPIRITPAPVATEQGYEVAAGPYHRGRELAMFQRALEGFAGCRVLVVEQTAGLEIWRHAGEMVNLPVMEEGLSPALSRGRVAWKEAGR